MNRVADTSPKPRRLSANLRSPETIIHCDWSKNRQRRWMAEAKLIDGKYVASAPEPVGNLNDPAQEEERFLTRIRQKRGEGTALIGFDFPIGLPIAYAQKAEVKQFLSFLKILETESQFFEVCRTESEISLARPFYPYAPGEKRQEQLTGALGIPFQQLLRTCDQATRQRSEASALFWTLGAKQVGKAAIVGWRDLLAPALRNREVQIWPFQGTLDTLTKPGTTVAAETYPAQYYAAIFGRLDGPKPSQNSRAGAHPQILKWIEDRADFMEIAPQMRAEIIEGFSHGGDDAFDAAIGLFGMIDAIQTYDADLEPEDPTIRNVEGWILGQPAIETAKLSPCRLRVQSTNQTPNLPYPAWLK